MMRLAAIFVALAFWAANVAAENTFFLNLPKYIRPGIDFGFHLELFEFPTAGSHCNISIRYEQDASSALVWPDAFKTVRLSSSKKTYQGVFYAPFELYSGAKLFVHVAFQGVKTKPRVQSVVVKRSASSIFTATDKPTYKPSDTVKFVVAVFDADLMPKDAAFKVQIEAPDGTPIMSKVVDSTDGSTVYQGELELSDDVIQGKYAISGNLLEEFSYVEKHFVVEEYVLPKFSCEMILDSSYAVTEGGAPANVKGNVICKYTYGQLVNGKLVLYIGKEKKVTVTDYSGDYQFDLRLTGYDAATLGKTTAIIRAEMTEKDTEKMDNVTASYTIYSSHFAAQVKKPPVRASNEKDYTCQVELVNSMGGPLSQWGDATTSDITNYELRYTVNGQSTYQSVAVTENPVTLTIPAVIGDVTVNFGSAVKVWFVYMSQSPNGYRQSIPASFTPPVLQSNSNMPLRVERVASSNSQDVCFKITPCTNRDNVYYQVVNNFRPEPIMTYSNCELDAPVCITTSREHAPMSMLVAFKVVSYSDGKFLKKELLTASLSFKKEFETEQQVEISVSPPAPQTVRPGDEVTLTFKTVGKGMVHYSGVDKSVELMRNPNNINMQEIESAWAAGRLFEEVRENPYPNPPGMIRPMGIVLDDAAAAAPDMMDRRKKRDVACFRYPCYSNRYTNPSKVLQDAGLTTITDLQFYSSGGFYEDDRVFLEAAAGGVGGAIDEDAEFEPNDREDQFFKGAGDGYGKLEVVPQAEANGDILMAAAGRVPDEEDGKAEANMPTDAEMDGEVEYEVEETRVRTDFPETWLWDHVQTNTAGPAGTYTATKTVTVPDTITSWVARAFGYSAAKGLGVAGPVEVTVFQPFFLSMNLPYSVINGEVLHLQILIFNYKDAAQQVNFILEDKPEWFTVVTKGAQSKSQLLSQSVTVDKSSSKSILIPLRLKKIGDLVLKASATSLAVDGSFSDAVERTLIVEPEGLPIDDGQELTPVNFINNGDVRTVDMDSFISIRRENIVPDSYRMYFHVTGDMMGPFITIITGKLKMPYGCGEQNIMSMSPSIFVALYLQATDRLEPDIEAKCRRYSGIGYLRQLPFMHADGSFTAFGEGSGGCGCMGPRTVSKKPGSTGLTAIVLKAFSTLAQTEMTYVSRVNLQKSFRFLANVTSPSNESTYFQEHGHVIHTEMQGGAAKNLSLTAYVLGAIMEFRDVAVVDQNDDLVEEIDAVLTGGLQWLQRKLDTYSDKLSNFQLAITAYVFARASKNPADNYYSEAELLLEAYEETKHETQPPALKCPNVIMFAEVRGKMPAVCLEKDLTKDACTTDADCTRKGELCCSSGCGGTKTCMRGRTPYRDTGPTEIETQGYVLMAYSLLSTKAPSVQARDTLIQKAMGYASSLISMRGPGGQFRTTQDTMVAMEALTRYALANPMSTGANFRVQALMGGSAVTDWVNVNNDNYIATQTAKLNVPSSAPPTGEITFNYEGSAGNAYVTVEALYNTNDGEAHSSLDGKVVTSIDDKNRKYVETCISNMDDNVSISSMVVAKVKCETGKKFAEVVPGQTSEISKVEINKNECGVTFYMMNDLGDNMKKERCYKFMVEEEFAVEDAKPGTVVVYDYYEPDNNYQATFKSDYMVQETTTPRGPTTGCSHAQVSLVLLLLTALLAVIQGLDRQ